MSRKAVDVSVIDQYLEELEREKRATPSKLLITGPGFQGTQPFQPWRMGIHDSIRIVDDLQSSRKILMDPKILEFLEAIFEKKPMLTQSLHFVYGSQQDVHQDAAFVGMSSPNKLAAMWVALEDVSPGTGELIYYPGSHLWDDFLFSKRFKAYDLERDGEGQMRRYHHPLRNMEIR